MKPLLISLALSFAGPAWADFACAFPTMCRGAEACVAGDEAATLHLGQDGWVMQRPGLDDLTLSLQPDAGTYFAHVFLGIEGYEDGMDATQLSIARDGTAFLTVHSMGYRPEAETLIGRCEVAG